MPYRTEWVPADIAFTHNSVNIYHVYKYNDIEQGSRSYNFSLCEDSDDDTASDDPHGFDVRQLDSWSKAEGETEWDRIKDALRLAIESGELSPDLLKNEDYEQRTEIESDSR